MHALIMHTRHTHTHQEQTFAVAPGAPAIAGFVKIVVHDTYGGEAYVQSLSLEGEAFGDGAQ